MKAGIISLIVAAILLGGAVLLADGRSTQTPGPEDTESNVSIVDGTQVIMLSAKGGYSPKVTMAKADMPAVIRVRTNGTFDCSSALTIPSIGYRTNLPPSGETDIAVAPQKVGTTLDGLCAMGMYSFQIRFN